MLQSPVNVSLDLALHDSLDCNTSKSNRISAHCFECNGVYVRRFHERTRVDDPLFLGDRTEEMPSPTIHSMSSDSLLCDSSTLTGTFA